MLVGLFAVFVVPILAAYSLNVWWPHWSPFGRMNHGELIEPAWEVELEAVAEHAAGRWILLHPAAAPCDDACEALLEFADRAIQCGIAGGGAVPSGDPWKAFDL